MSKIKSEEIKPTFSTEDCIKIIDMTIKKELDSIKRSRSIRRKEGSKRIVEFYDAVLYHLTQLRMLQDGKAK